MRTNPFMPRRMLAHEINKAHLPASGAPAVFGVEEPNGKLHGHLTWQQACALASKLWQESEELETA